jgi:hypothetical protein
MTSAPGVNDAGIEGFADWRQGDVLAINWADHFGLAAGPLSGAPISAPFPPELVALRHDVEAVAVISQTCEVVATAEEQPFIEVAPVVRLEGNIAGLAGKGWSPRYAPIPALGLDAFVDLDMPSRLEKSVVRGVGRQRGCLTDETARRFAKHVGHKYSRPAFPDDIVASFRDMIDRIKGKVGKGSDEGRRADLLDDVRVLVTPEFWATKIKLFFYFVLPSTEDGIVFDPPVWDEQIDEWLQRCKLNERVEAVDGMPISKDVMTAEAWDDSDSVIQADIVSP